MLKKSKTIKPIKLKSITKGKAKYFCNSFISALCLTLCPFILILGIIISDYNTRKIGLSDAKPVIYFENDDGMDVHVFGYTVSISSSTSEKIEHTGEIALSFVPPQLRILCAVPSAINNLFYSICEIFT